jgi:hypothetical protein
MDWTRRRRRYASRNRTARTAESTLFIFDVPGYSIIAGWNSRATSMGPIELTSMVSAKSRGWFSQK